MKEIAIVSGKGGTGKTSLVGAFAYLTKPCVIADCDVDAANLHLMLSPTTDSLERESFQAGYLAYLDQNLCNSCGLCFDNCRFGAITKEDKLYINPLFCEGCGVCSDVCPEKAISLQEKTVGEVLAWETRFGQLVQGRLGMAMSTSGKLVTSVRKKAKETALTTGANYLLIDGSPGIGCPVIASLTGVDAAVIVTEPTVSGEHDLKRILDLCRHFNLPAFVIINKFDLNKEQTQLLIEKSKQMGAKIAGQIKYDPAFYRAVEKGQTILEIDNADSGEQVRSAWSYVLANL